MEKAIAITVENGSGQIQLLQRALDIEYGEAKAIMRKMQSIDVVGPDKGDGQPLELIAAMCDKCNQSFVPYPLKPLSICSECADAISLELNTMNDSKNEQL